MPERHILKERVAGVVLIARGTLFKGYAGLLIIAMSGLSCGF